MTLAQIMRHALRQMDEDPADIDEYKDLFTVYANQGYMIALRQYVRPRETMTLRTDEEGYACLDGLDILRVIDVRDENGRSVPVRMDEDGMRMKCSLINADLTAVCEVRYAEMTRDDDEPRLPLEMHAALADYVCYRHLSSGNLAKQSRAQHFRNEFYAQMQMATPRPSGGVTGYKNLYEVTGFGYMR